jgi:hypothetical protein
VISNYALKKAVKGYVTIQSLQFVAGKSTQMYGGMNIFSDALGLVNIFKDFQFLKGKNYTINGTLPYRIPCYEQVII